jgi:hypothetical protein
MFEAIRGAGDSAFIVCDFEIAIIKACKSVFNISTSMYGCLFHLSQSIHKHVSANSALNKLYLEQSAEGKATRTAIHSLAALAFIPPNEVPVRFVELRRAYALPGSHQYQQLNVQLFNIVQTYNRTSLIPQFLININSLI